MLQTRSLDPALRASKSRLGSADTDSAIPAFFMSGDDARSIQPALSRNVIGAVLMTEAGTVDAEALDETLAHDIEENHGAVVNTRIKNVSEVDDGWQVVF